MIKELMKSIREYKRDSILTPILVSLEVVMECIIPFIVAQLVNEIKAGSGMGVISRYGLILVVMALMSLAFGAGAGSARPRPADSPKTCARICFTGFRIFPLKISINFLPRL